MSTYFYSSNEIDSKLKKYVDLFKEYSALNDKLIYIMNRPILDKKYQYTYQSSLIVLSPKHRVLILNFDNSNKAAFEDFFEDLMEDISSIADKFQYKNILGRRRDIEKKLIRVNVEFNNEQLNSSQIEELFSQTLIEDLYQQTLIDLIISLFIGSINEIENKNFQNFTNDLDKVKNKIQLFDADQTSFIYNFHQKKAIKIQGLSGTGKTELLLHKLRDIYINGENSKIYFTCYSKVLANTLRSRIPSFFNLMRVEKQIAWNKDLWCSNAWGSGIDIHSGLYRYLCDFYNYEFVPYYKGLEFKVICVDFLNYLKIIKENNDDFTYAFTHIFIDESQDFDRTFFELCEFVTKERIYIAGDVFQSIHDEQINTQSSIDYLLGKCYRTDPRTLMFAHALGMGFFEEKKIRWLNNEELKVCGYNVKEENNRLILSREPIRRFEDLEDNSNSVELIEYVNIVNDIISVISNLREKFSTIQPDDISIIFLDNENEVYNIINRLQYKVTQVFNWEINKAYETKFKLTNTLFVSNRNNVKGLEFPIVICVTNKITRDIRYRNALYTMLTRSYLKTFLLVQKNATNGVNSNIIDGLKHILTNNEIEVNIPNQEEQLEIKKTFDLNLSNYFNIDKEIERIFNKYDYENNKISIIKDMINKNVKKELNSVSLEKFIISNIEYL